MLRRICNVASTLLAAVLLVAAGMLYVPRLIGFLPYVVLSGSMEPSYPVGGIVFIRPVAPESVQVNDVIMFTLSNGVQVTHRVTSINSENRTFSTKGDANEAGDFAPVPFENLTGKAAFCLPLLGYAAAFLKTGPGIVAALLLLLPLILVSFLPAHAEKLKPAGDSR